MVEYYQKYFIILSKGSPFRANTISHQYNETTKAYFQYCWDCFYIFLANTRYYIAESHIRMLSVWMPLLFVVTRYGRVTVQRKLNTPGVISLYPKITPLSQPEQSQYYTQDVYNYFIISNDIPIRGNTISQRTHIFNINDTVCFVLFFGFFSCKFCKCTVAYPIKSLIRMRSVWLPLVFTNFVEVIVQREISTPRVISLYHNATPLSQLDESHCITWDKSSHNYFVTL